MSRHTAEIVVWALVLLGVGAELYSAFLVWFGGRGASGKARSPILLVPLIMYLLAASFANAADVHYPLRLVLILVAAHLALAVASRLWRKNDRA